MNSYFIRFITLENRIIELSKALEKVVHEDLIAAERYAEQFEQYSELWMVNVAFVIRKIICDHSNKGNDVGTANKDNVVEAFKKIVSKYIVNSINLFIV